MTLTDRIGNSCRVAAAEEMRVEVHHDDSLVEGELPEGGVWHVSGRVAQGVCWWMAEYNRCLGYVQGVPHCLHRHVRQVDYHAQSVHLFNDALKAQGRTTLRFNLGELQNSSSSCILRGHHVHRTWHLPIFHSEQRACTNLKRWARQGK